MVPKRTDSDHAHQTSALEEYLLDHKHLMNYKRSHIIGRYCSRVYKQMLTSGKNVIRCELSRYCGFDWNARR